MTELTVNLMYDVELMPEDLIQMAASDYLGSENYDYADVRGVGAPTVELAYKWGFDKSDLRAMAEEDLQAGAGDVRVDTSGSGVEVSFTVHYDTEMLVDEAVEAMGLHDHPDDYEVY